MEAHANTRTISGSIERPDWTASDTLNASIGQGYLIVNPLQLAVMAARIASGRNVQPQLIGVHDEPAPLLGIPPEHLDAVRGGMWEVVNGDGTAGASRLQLPGIEMGGKTGTAQVRKIAGSQRGQSGDWKYRDHGLFVFFAPTDNPRYAGVGGDRAWPGRRARRGAGRQGRADLFVRQGKGAGQRSPALEAQWGGTLAERTARRQAADRGRRQGQCGAARDDQLGDHPPAARPPAVAADLAGLRDLRRSALITLYSAAGGSASPWALKQALTILFFLSARDRHVAASPKISSSS